MRPAAKPEYQLGSDNFAAASSPTFTYPLNQGSAQYTFAKIIELYMENLKQLHSVNLGAEELAPVFRPEWTGK